jgi:hypothetical protein
VRLWRVDRSEARPEDQVHCLDSLRLRSPDIDGVGGWSVTAHGAECVLMCGHGGIPGRVCVLSVDATTARFSCVGLFALGRDADAVRALRIDCTISADSPDLQSIAADGCCFDRLFVPWAQLRPPSSSGPPPPAAEPSVAAAEALQRQSSGSHRLLVPGELPRTSSKSAAAFDAPDTAAAAAQAPSRGSSTLLVPGALSGESTAPFALAGSAPTTAAAPVDTAAGPSGSSAPEAKPSAGLSVSTGLDMLTNLFGDSEPSASSPQPPPFAQEPSAAPEHPVPPSPGRRQRVGSPSLQPLSPSAAAAAVAAAAAAAAAVSAANSPPKATRAADAVGPAPADATAIAGEASGTGRKKKAKAVRDRNRGGEPSLANGGLVAEASAAGYDGAVTSVTGASIRALASKCDGLHKDLEAVREAQRVQGEQVRLLG